MAIGAFIEFVKKQNKVLIADTTLRDGEQAPGASLDIEQKLAIARQMDELGVDSIEAGFPISSKEEFEAVKLIAGEIKRPMLSALSRKTFFHSQKVLDEYKGEKIPEPAAYIEKPPEPEELLEAIQSCLK